LALPHTAACAGFELGFGGGWWECVVEQSLRQLLRFNLLLIRIKVQSSLILAHLFTTKFCATCQKKVSGLASEQGL
jgi:hypothetical protein